MKDQPAAARRAATKVGARFPRPGELVIPGEQRAFAGMTPLLFFR